MHRSLETTVINSELVVPVYEVTMHMKTIVKRDPVNTLQALTGCCNAIPLITTPVPSHRLCQVYPAKFPGTYLYSWRKETTQRPVRLSLLKHFGRNGTSGKVTLLCPLPFQIKFVFHLPFFIVWISFFSSFSASLSMLNFTPYVTKMGQVFQKKTVKFFFTDIK